MKLIILLLVFCQGLAMGQETLDVRFPLTQRTTGTPFSLPFSLGSEALSMRPTLQLGLTRAKIEYSQPVVLNRFNFYPVQKDLGWIEVRRNKIEVGAGIAALIKSKVPMGLIPYKGSLQTMIRYKKSQEEKSLPFKMPRELEELNSWAEGDSATFQSYGGIRAYVGASIGIVDIARATIGIQNQFIIEFRKNDPNIITLSIAEENLKSRQVDLGPVISSATFANFKGSKLIAEFSLDIREPLHHELFKEALSGNLQMLQDELPVKHQKLSWDGRDRQLYIGIPSVAGVVKDKGHYDLNEDGEETELDFTGRRNKGYLTPLRNYQNYVYQTDESIVLVWSAELNKVNARVFEKAFYSKGRIMGVKGFDREMPEATKFGSMVSQIGVHISRKEAEKARGIDMNLVTENLKLKCEQEKLSCRKQKNLRKIITKFTDLVHRPWNEMRGEMGQLLIKEPALIHAVVKTLKYRKEVYFKFLSEKYQSLEGSSAIEI